MEDQGAPLLFRCPISMELMVDPITISTGVTYERKNIEKWFYSYQKSTCPATMQRLDSFDLTPNHTLKRLIDSWRLDSSAADSPPPARNDILVSLLADIESTPFKVSSLKKIQSLVETSHDVRSDFVGSGGVRVLARTMSQAVHEGAADFSAFRACEECVGILHHLPIADDADTAGLLSKPECTKPMMLLLQRGSAEARLHTMTILQKLSRTSKEWTVSDQEIDVVKSLLELLSDEISTTKLSSRALDVLIEMVGSAKKNRHRAVEAGAVRVLIELLPDATTTSAHKTERVLMLLDKLCGCPEGRSAFADHGLGVAVVSTKMLRVSELATKLCVKILAKTCSLVPTERVIGDMVAFGAVRKLFCLLHIDGRSSTKDRALGMIRVHGGVWRQYPCFPCELKDFLKLVRSCN